MGRVQGKVALISGGASGLGLASGRRLAEEGATVILADVDVAGGERAAAAIDGARFMQLDVTDEQRWIELIARLEQEFGRLDVLVNSAGIVRLATIEDRLVGIENRLDRLTDLLERLVPHERDR